MGCSRTSHRNEIVLEDTEKVKEGMTKQEVIAALGVPVFWNKKYHQEFLLYAIKPTPLADGADSVPAYLFVTLESGHVLKTSYVWQVVK